MLKPVTRACLVAGALFLAAACSSTDEDDGLPTAPHMTSAETMAGGLHVSWANPDTPCDAIELERRASRVTGERVTDFALLYTLPGAIDNKHDATATEDLIYAYRARCQKAGQYSSYSNEVSGNPTN